MPTGYTAIVEEREVSFEEFVWRCARAFGALVEMRDDSIDAKIPERFAPSDYHVKELAKARTRLTDLQKLPVTVAAERAEADNASAAKAWRKSEADRKRLLARYDALREKAKEWTPPTAEHEGLRTFMLQQIDVSTEYMRKPCEKPVRLSTTEWMKRAVNSAAWDVNHHEEQLQKERERHEGRNAWLAALRKSVPYPGKD